MRQDLQHEIEGKNLDDAEVTYSVGFLNEIQLRIDAQVYYFHYRSQEECMADYHDAKNYIKTHKKTTT